MDEVRALYKEILETKTSKYTTDLENQRLKHELATKNEDYLRITGALHVRSVCETFEKTKPILQSNRDRLNKWNDLTKSNDPQVKDIQDAIKNHKLQNVEQVASGLFNKVNSAVHNDYAVSRDRLVIKKKFFTPDEHKLLNVIIESYPLTNVEYID
ncbi:hypothetical protein ILUMI_05320 [Ignelater luminosus]|uniref:Uncharacterized protein n=1 Tax=Ignelater luminosus TaxID=2038154 RepID=A0A8K0DB93_IGNLU|nr:hypothetical protein ILUMI_05320 [Ignelater luminosus]